MRLIADSLQTPVEKTQLVARADEILSTLIDAGVIVREELADAVDALTPELAEALPAAADSPLAAAAVYRLTVDLPEDFALDQERDAKGRALAEMKAQGIDYDERMDKLAEITHPKPLEDELNVAFATYCEKVPWARDYCLRPKSILRDMLETAADFKTYVQHYKLSRSEGTLLRYLSDAWRVLDRTIPTEKRTESLDDVVAWLGFIVRTTDSSLVDAWEAAGELPDALPPEIADAVVKDRHGLTVLVRNALWLRVRLFAREEIPTLGGLDQPWGMGERRWRAVLEEFHAAHDELLLDADARSAAYFLIDDKDEKSQHVWHVTQILHDADGDNDFQIQADLDLDATQEQGEPVFKRYRAGAIEDLMEES